ncbi:hypothetical protein PCH_Pc21g08010 [Penicillium rubens Wisconsin 54-1255]|uniref:Uncharacterized protein n=1 Tax=Penicillium rubens (strain ATCC 28089 / DSM 1075 / NRRL 1951 / Wisconsin 54-1255) TaxID=500485 RepID=B6HLJ5_PENRW|nr:hypothetical protein PCH_Pc21g08010 [Penicillium rubens Wisconsin 54-1255]
MEATHDLVPPMSYFLVSVAKLGKYDRRPEVEIKRNTGEITETIQCGCKLGASHDSLACSVLEGSIYVLHARVLQISKFHSILETNIGFFGFGQTSSPPSSGNLLGNLYLNANILFEEWRTQTW